MGSPRFPADMLEWLDTYGRHRLDEWDSGIDRAAIWARAEPLLEAVRQDREGFVSDLEELMTGAAPGSFAALDAGGLVWEALNDEDPFAFPAAARLIDASIAFKIARGLPMEIFRGYETARWLDVTGQPPYR